jgi:hypothetical protein
VESKGKAPDMADGAGSHRGEDSMEAVSGVLAAVSHQWWQPDVVLAGQ